MIVVDVNFQHAVVLTPSSFSPCRVALYARNYCYLLQYWERKRIEYAHGGRRLTEALSIAEWILGDPTATNLEECTEV